MHVELTKMTFPSLLDRALPAGMDAPPRGEGGAPRPALWGGGVPRPAPPRKNDQNRGEVAGQNKGPNLNFLQ